MEQTLANQLAALVATLEQTNEAKQPGNVAAHLLYLARIAASCGLDEPLVADIWLSGDLESRAEELGIPIPGRDQARAMMAALNRHYDSEVGINQGVITAALTQNGGRL